MKPRKLAIVVPVVILTFLLMMGPAYAGLEPGRSAQAGGPLPRTRMHIVQRGETMFSIARQYGVTADAISHANGLPDPRKIYVGQRLTIPTRGQVTNSKESTIPYVVQAGDTLNAIAQRYRTTWQTLAQVNGMLSPAALYAGQVIRVPMVGGRADVESAVFLLGEGAVSVVHPDDTLFRIALRYGLSPQTLALESRLANPALLYPGQELLIPGQDGGLLPAPFVAVTIEPLPAVQGETMVVVVRTTEPVTLEGRVFEQTVRFAKRSEGVYYGLVGVHVFTEPGLYEMVLRATDGEGQSTEIVADVKVAANRFGYERIELPASRNSLLAPEVIDADRKRLEQVSLIFSEERQWEGPFQRPCVGGISAYFGTHRAYNGSPYTSYHSGVDFRAPTGAPIYAPAAGTVVMAEKLGLWGNALALDHGWGVLTGYGHLSAIEVELGQHVETGDLVARVGNTGLSTGSHLHWQVWVGGTSVNGLQWLEAFYPWSEKELVERIEVE